MGGKCNRAVKLGKAYKVGWYGVILKMGDNVWASSLYWTGETWGSDHYYVVKRSEQPFERDVDAKEWAAAQVKNHWVKK